MNELKLIGLDKIKNNPNKINIFNIIGCQKDENIHSDILYYLLKSEAGNKFISSILDSLNIIYPKEINEASIKVYREYHRLDLTIFFNQIKFLVAIENKIGAEEREKQITDYQMILKKYYQDYSGVYLFLTQDGKKSSSDNKFSKFKCYNISYKELLESLDKIKNIDSISNCVSTVIENIKENIAMNNKDINNVYKIWGNKVNRDKLKILINNRPTILTIQNKLYEKINNYLMTKNDEIDEKHSNVYSDKELHLRVKSLNKNNIPVIFNFYDLDTRENTPALRIVLWWEDFDSIPKKRIREYKERYDFLAFEKVKNWNGVWYALYTGKSLEADFFVTEDHDYGDELVNILFIEFKKEYEKLIKII
jgi:hypothetical protein